jgi:4-hydroxybenzoate polyprenyltransferase
MWQKELKYLFSALRPDHWIKNLFIFLPMIFGKKLFTFPVNLKTLNAFFVFSITASAGYLINDAIDFEKDKLHPTKCLRPIASGKISIRKALIISCILGILSFAFSFILNIYLGYIIIAYLLFSFIYTRILKEIVIIDVFCIGIFFSLRILAGSIIAEVNLSHWIIVMTILLSLFLGFNKRRQELKLVDKGLNLHRRVLDKYSIYFIDQMIIVITSSIVVSYMLYTVDVRTLHEFGTNHLLYSIPFVYYGIFRYLFLIHKQNKGDNPTHILVFDIPMQINLALWLVVCIGVIYFGV